MRYGDLTFKNEPVGNFYANMDLPEIAPQRLFEKIFLKAKQYVSAEEVSGSA